MADSSAFALHRPDLSAALRSGDEKIRQIGARNVRRVAGGTVLINADEPHDFVYRMRSGWAARVRTLEDGRSQYILVFLPGDLFAVKSMFITEHPDAVQVLCDSTIEQIDYRELKKAYDRDPEIALRCTWQIVEEERRLHTWIVGLGRGSAEERIALFFLEFRARLVLSGTLPPQAASYELPMTQEQIADHIGLSTVHVNRTLRHLRERRIASLRGKTVSLLDEAELRAIARPLMDTFERRSFAFGGES